MEMMRGLAGTWICIAAVFGYLWAMISLPEEVGLCMLAAWIMGSGIALQGRICDWLSPLDNRDGKG